MVNTRRKYVLAGITGRTVLIALGLCLILTSRLWAVNVYDVIELSRKGYSDQEILAIIEATDSVFELTAEDVPQLKNLGVSEPVIRKMLTAVAPTDAGAVEPNRAESKQSRREPQTHEPHPGGDQHAGQQTNASIAETTQGLVDDTGQGPASGMPIVFSVVRIAEEQAGDHQHLEVLLNGLPLFVLREEGDHASVMERGLAVARRLDIAASQIDGTFRFVHQIDGGTVVYESGADQRRISIVSVLQHDAQAYDKRSERHVSMERLGQYWSALLNDYWAIAFRQQSPRRLAYLHQGDALRLLFDVTQTSVTGVAGDNLGSAARQLPQFVRRHLERLATAVPEDFRIELDRPGNFE